MSRASSQLGLKVFISYSRTDTAFADEIAGGLELQNFEILMDRQSIHEGEDWKKRLGNIIASADTVVFVLSPASATSPVCAWEVGEAERLSKRILPVLATALDGIPPPAQLAALNYVRFDAHDDGRPRSFVSGLGGLCRALNTDIDWLREHTRLLSRALEWDAAGRDPNRLLIGQNVVESARRWLDGKPHEAPAPVALHHEFINASEAAEVARSSAERERAERLARAVARTRWALVGAIVLAVFASGSGILAYQQRLKAEAEQSSAVKSRVEAEASAAEARAQRDVTLLTQSKYLAGLAQENLRNGDVGNAIALAREALPANLQNPNRPIASLALDTLYASYFAPRYDQRGLKGHTEFVSGARALHDGRLLTWSWDKTARLWSAAGDPGPVLSGHTVPVRGAIQLDDGRILTWAGGLPGHSDFSPRLWQPDGTPGPLLAGHSAFIRGALQLRDGRLFTWSNDQTGRIWNSDGSQAAVLKQDILGVLQLQDQATLTYGSGPVAQVWTTDGNPVAKIAGQLRRISGVLQLADGRIVMWGGEATIGIWPANGGARTELVGHLKPVKRVVQLKDGRLVSLSEDRTARIWSVEGHAIAELGDQSYGVGNVLGLQGGNLLTWGASPSTDDHALRLWSREGAAIAVLKGHSDVVDGALEVGDGRLLSWAADGTIRLWDQTGAAGPVLRGHTSNIHGCLQLADGRVLSWGSDGMARLWRVGGEIPSAILGPPQGFSANLLALKDGRLLTWDSSQVLKADPGAQIWTSDGIRGPLLQGSRTSVAGALSLSNGSILVWSHQDQTPRLYSINGDPITRLNGHVGGVEGALELLNGDILTWGTDATARAWSSDGRSKFVLQGHEHVVTGARQLEDGRVMTWSKDGNVRLWSQDGLPALTLEGRGVLLDALLLKSGRFIAWGESSWAQIWNEDGSKAALLEGHTGRINKVLELDDGRILTTSGDKTVRIWSTAGKLLSILSGHTAAVDNALHLSDGRIATSGSDRAVRIWNQDGTANCNLQSDKIREMRGVLQLRDGRLLTWSGDGIAFVWTSECAPVRELVRHERSISGARQLADGRVYTWGRGSGGRLTPLEGDLLQWADKRLSELEPLTPAERCQYFLDPEDECKTRPVPTLGKIRLWTR